MVVGHSVFLVGCVEAVVWSVVLVIWVAGILVVVLVAFDVLVASWAVVGRLVVV